ncbi:MAG: RidA/YER057c/UK114 superfamily, group 1 [uncultured Rubrobacteraceae bacterium]|uniref:RidA/YER057c/UK114 superfamily, group 1 n=1 Tax=uncultured Rubrobacteraceae bacterium TaxID=349277 RepID=A0A6J4P441_9ACTN|nr:MAG: RidA/YER057c/UK114 superfamily, group 1 [uncultured Rubrobacteraceae bacterium]
MTPSNRLKELGLELPPVASPAGSYIPATRTGHLVFTAGQLPLSGGELHRTGKVGDGVTPEEARECARLCALNALAAAAEKAGSLDNLRDVVKVTGFVASAPGFNGQAGVLNGASELLGEVFGEAGLHARSAVGVTELPLDAPVEVELIVSLDPPA